MPLRNGESTSLYLPRASYHRYEKKKGTLLLYSLLSLQFFLLLMCIFQDKLECSGVYQFFLRNGIAF